MLIIFGGFPGVGKTTLAKALSKHLECTYVRIDSIEQSIKKSLLKIDEVIDAGYVVGYAVAKDNLILGRTVIADSVNPIQITREAWLNVAKEVDCKAIEVEVICSDKVEHKRRVESRKADIIGHKLPDWQKVEARHYEPWSSKHIVIDTAGKTVEESLSNLIGLLGK